ncbi:MAG: hypothetical protein ACI8YQ_001559 [Polaribacter sp.]|jgi:hypothetical protein
MGVVDIEPLLILRKVIKKQEANYVKVILYSDESLLEIPLETIECFPLHVL